MKIAFLGLGRMGRELVNHVISAGHEVTVWNRTASATEGAVAQGARAAATPADAVTGAEAVITMFFGPDAVREVVTAQQLPFEPGALWIDATTIAPDDAQEFSLWAHARGIRHVYSPVLGTVGPAREGTLAVLLGGEADAVAAARPIVSLWGDERRIREFPTPRQAATAKLIANLALAVVAEGIVEALRLGRGEGMDTQQVLDFLPLTQLAAQVTVKGETIAHRSWSEDVAFAVDALLKDTGFMTAASDHALPAVEAFATLLRGAQAAGLGGADYIAALHEEA